MDKAKKRELLKRLLKDVSRYKLLYFMIAILTAVQMALSLISPILMMKIIDVLICTFTSPPERGLLSPDILSLCRMLSPSLN